MYCRLAYLMLCSRLASFTKGLAVSLAIGMSYKREGREFEHYNSQAALFGQAIREMTGLLSLFGGDASNLMLGAGDLYVTIFGGRTRKLGTLLVGHSR